MAKTSTVKKKLDDSNNLPTAQTPLMVLHDKLKIQYEWATQTLKSWMRALRSLPLVETSPWDPAWAFFSPPDCSNFSTAGTGRHHHLQSWHHVNVNIRHPPSSALFIHSSVLLTNRNPPCPSPTHWVLQQLGHFHALAIFHDGVL